MVLIINGIRAGVEWKNLVCFPEDYEAAFDLLSTYVATGLTLLDVAVGDGGELQKLPVSAFDGTSFSPYIQGLQKTWEEILNRQPKRIEHQNADQFREWDRQLISYYEMQIGRVCKNIVCNSNALQKATKKTNHKLRPSQLSHYESMQKKYLQLLNGFQTSHQKAIKHLAKIEGS